MSENTCDNTHSQMPILRYFGTVVACDLKASYFFWIVTR